MIKLRHTTLYPSEFPLDIIVYKHKSELHHFLSKRYGREPEYYWDNFNDAENFTSFLSVNEDGNVKKDSIVVVLAEEDIDILSHELVHVLFYIEKHIGLNIAQDSQEWVASMYEYLFSIARKFENYQKMDV